MATRAPGPVDPWQPVGCPRMQATIPRNGLVGQQALDQLRRHMSFDNIVADPHCIARLHATGYAKSGFDRCQIGFVPDSADPVRPACRSLLPDVVLSLHDQNQTRTPATICTSLLSSPSSRAKSAVLPNFWVQFTPM